MSRFTLRRAVAAAALCASVVLLAACGSSSTESALTPSRLIAFGDGFSDVGQSATNNKYTVNDATTNHWLQQVAARFERPIAASSTSGGLGYARLGARIAGKPSVTDDAATLTVTEQIDAFIAGGGTFGANDLIFISGGMTDAVFQAKAVLAGTQTAAVAETNARAAGTALAELAKRVVDAGAKQVVVVGSVNLGITPWGQASGQYDAMEAISRGVNDAFLIGAVDRNLGSNVLYVDAAYYFNLLANDPGNFNMDNSRVVACTSVNPGVGIGIGVGQVDSSLCTPSTIVAGVNYTRYMFADALYTAPTAQRQFGDYAYDRIRNRW
ncbi:SGNH/GDSL hydrolase family protein [Pseudorhodoferax sp. Leaf267]|uniref:SGNH/GDSL hydrolase family protein n=1 Tax=Pseudorhodoferax sp. Leaf267 TaxID=1736316 RepID=UPI0006F7909F|nr:SGNH/GDSL hydrolase family protein [Pseudorhodoferax sp. Leaf267]KQP12545.1 hypothetical protein ASF43_20040 [Pseudorhodoferax sp. Leaf267]